MTDHATPAAPVAGLEEKLRERIAAMKHDGWEVSLFTQAADALAKARVALEEIERRSINCPLCLIWRDCVDRPTTIHKPTCPIGAALEAMV